MRWALRLGTLLAAVLAAGVGAMATAGGAPASDVTVVTERPDLGRQVFSLVNGYRASLGLSSLAWDDRLAAAAAWHARWLASQCYFVEEVYDDSSYRVRLADGCLVTHRDGLGRGPGERAAAFGFPHPWAVGENIAAPWGEEPQEALRQWQGSPGHDANQRRPDYALAGSGAACSRYSGSLVFRDPVPPLCFYVVVFALGEEQTAGGEDRPGPTPAPPLSPPRWTSAPFEGREGGGQEARAKDPCAGREVAPPPAEMAIYRAAPGDTLAGLAARFLGDPGRYCDLAAWNGIGAPYLLRAGQELKVPAPPGDDVESEAQDEGQGGEVTTQEVKGEDTTAAPQAPSEEEEHGPDNIAVQATPVEEVEATPEDDWGAATGDEEGDGHPVLAFILRVLRRLRELWPW